MVGRNWRPLLFTTAQWRTWPGLVPRERMNGAVRQAGRGPDTGVHNRTDTASRPRLAWLKDPSDSS